MKYMKQIKIILILLTAITVTYSCSNKTTDTTTTKESSSILSDKLSRLSIAVSYSSDKDLLESHYNNFPERWNLVFDFLENSLDTLTANLGAINLSDDVFYSVATYNTKLQDDLKYESHKKYIDLQYVMSGKEYIGLIFDRSRLDIVEPYIEDKDYELYASTCGDKILADSSKFFLFFLEDNHMPCIQVDGSEEVKKLVIKIKID